MTDHRFWQEVERLLGHRIDKVTPVRTVWKISCGDDEQFIIKRWDYSRNQLEWMISMLYHCSEQDYFHSPLPVQLMDGMYYMMYNQQPYIIFPFVRGESVSPFHYDGVEKATTCLALYHLSAERVPVSPHYQRRKQSSHLQRCWVRFAWFERYYDELKIQGCRSIKDQLILTYGREIIHRSKNVLHTLQDVDVLQLWHREISNGAVAHRDTAHHNFLIDPNEEVQLIDFDLSGYDLRVYDLWQWLSRLSVHLPRPIEQIELLIEHYCTLRPLNRKEHTVLNLLLDYPYNTMRELYRAYQYDQRSDDQHILETIHKELG